ncbi:hypothetical protein CHL78_012285 [Romboutsia weinsteinii]|uniref:Uncharacterized protein n=1 Tax=Romboutsia weinsteinii TaxID=2020949 RepID=A0A371J200_9FIRM|nr:hypothetical protein [Romboutsia weinsteinii]RDY26724.1 hypothetical protein CHL78_012285 [Romboutsia weinsteinii]
MSTKKKIFLFFIIVLSIIFISSESQIVSSISAFGVVLLILSMQLSEYILRKKLIKKIERENIKYIKAKENNKWMIILMPILIFNIYRAIKSRYVFFKGEYSYTNILAYINSFESDEKVVLLMAIIVIIFLIITMGQVLLNPCIVSKDKVIFCDGLVLDTDKIEEIEYKDSFIRKNKKIITISKGFTDRKIITSIEDFNKVKMLLEYKS